MTEFEDGVRGEFSGGIGLGWDVAVAGRLAADCRVEGWSSSGCHDVVWKIPRSSKRPNFSSFFDLAMLDRNCLDIELYLAIRYEKVSRHGWHSLGEL